MKIQLNILALKWIINVKLKFNFFFEKKILKCYKILVKGRKTTKRGCAAIQSSQDKTCDIAFQSTTNYDGCMLCNKNTCNNAGSITGSILIFFVTIIVINF